MSFIKRLVAFIFYGNYFYGLCTVALSIEASLQQQVALNIALYYIFLYTATIVYYTKAYLGEINPATVNKRSQWYLKNRKFVWLSQYVFICITLGIGIYLFIGYIHNFKTLTIIEWAEIFIFPIIALSYYGISPIKSTQINLRQTGWLKPFFIGFVWGGAVTIYPLLFYQIQTGFHHSISFYGSFLFIKNWMFITVLSIMFDIKDYAADHNRRLKTFVVRIGIRKTIFFIIIPLSIIGFISYIIFVVAMHFPLVRILFNSIPFILLLIVAGSLQHRKSILYYLAVIDGLMLVKAACGILGVLLS